MSTNDLPIRVPQIIPTTPNRLQKYIHSNRLFTTVELGFQVTLISSNPSSTKPILPDGWLEFVHPGGYTYLHDPKRRITTITTNPAIPFEEVLRNLRPEQAPTLASLELVVHDASREHDVPTYLYYFVDHDNRQLIWLDHHSATFGARPMACPVHTSQQQYWNHVIFFPTHFKLPSTFPRELDIDFYESLIGRYTHAQAAEHEPHQISTSETEIAKTNLLVAQLQLRLIRPDLDCQCNTSAPSRGLKLLMVSKEMWLGTSDNLLKELEFLWVDNGGVSLQQVQLFKFFKSLAAEWSSIAAWATVSLLMSFAALSILGWNAWLHPLKAPLMTSCTMIMVFSLATLVVTLILTAKYFLNTNSDDVQALTPRRPSNLEPQLLALQLALPQATFLWTTFLMSTTFITLPTFLLYPISLFGTLGTLVLFYSVYVYSGVVIGITCLFFNRNLWDSIKAGYLARSFSIWVILGRVGISIRKLWRPAWAKLCIGAGCCILSYMMVSGHIFSFLPQTVGMSSIIYCLASTGPCLAISCISCRWIFHVSDSISAPYGLNKPVDDEEPPNVPHLASGSFDQKPKSPPSVGEVAEGPMMKELRECMDVCWKTWKSYNLGNSRFNLRCAIKLCQRKVLERCTTEGRKIEECRLEAMQIIALWQELTGRVFCPDAPKIDFLRVEPSDEMRARGPHTWAVLIGINNYDDPRLQHLTGPRSDVDKLKDYLLSYLDVPESHIWVLQDTAATRANILNVLYDYFRDNAEIAKDDNIILWFGGHGIMYPESDATGQGYLALCPADRGMETNDGVIPDISCRELNIFLKELADVKGNHITVVLDCCHSAGAARGLTPDICTPLPGVHPSVPLEAADKDPRRRDTRKANCRKWESDLTTHVLMCSSKEYEQSYDIYFPPSGSGGRFTAAFLALLQSLDAQTMTYEQAVERIGPLGYDQMCQTPVVLGENRNCRIWFMGEVSPPSRPEIDGRPSQASLGGDSACLPPSDLVLIAVTDFLDYPRAHFFASFLQFFPFIRAYAMSHTPKVAA